MQAQQIALAIRAGNSVLLAKEPIQLISQASYSTVLSLASFIIKHFPSIAPPEFDHKESPQSESNNFPPSIHKLHDRLFEPWCDYLCQRIRCGQSYVLQKTAYFLVESESTSYVQNIKKEDKNHLFELTKIQFDKQQQSGLQKIQNIFKIAINQVNFNVKIAVINFSTSTLRTDPFHPKVHLQGLMQGIWFNNQKWNIFRILKNQIPSVNQLQKYDAIILTGSSLSVNDNNIYINAFLDNLKATLSINTKLKVLGICFGHQAITKMFGGKVQRVRWIGGIEHVELATELIKKLSFFKPIHQSKHVRYSVSQFHSDQVVQVASNFKLIACSKSCQSQAQVSDDQRILSFQFHPEYISPYVKKYQKRLKQYNGEELFGQFEHSQDSHDYHKDSVFLWRKVISNFLRCY